MKLYFRGMRYMLVVALCTTLCNAVGLAQKCIYRVKDKDTFTGDTRAVTRAAISFGLKSGFWFEFRRVGEACFLDINWGGGAATVIEGAVMKVKFADGTVRDLVCVKDGIREIVSGGTSSSRPTYSLSQEDLRIFASTAITDYRFYTLDGYTDYSLSDKKAASERIQEAAACLVRTWQP